MMDVQFFRKHVEQVKNSEIKSICKICASSWFFYIPDFNIILPNTPRSPKLPHTIIFPSKASHACVGAFTRPRNTYVYAPYVCSCGSTLNVFHISRPQPPSLYCHSSYQRHNKWQNSSLRNFLYSFSSSLNPQIPWSPAFRSETPSIRFSITHRAYRPNWSLNVLV